MQRSKPSVYCLFRKAEGGKPVSLEMAETALRRVQSQSAQSRTRELAAQPSLKPYKRCSCGSCRACVENAKWDRIFAKFEVKETEVRGLYGCALVDL